MQMFIKNPKFSWQLGLFCEAGMVKMSKDGKIGYSRDPCMFVSYLCDHDSNCYIMYNPKTKWVTKQEMLFGLNECIKEVNPAV